MWFLLVGNEMSRDLCGDMERDKNRLLMIIFNVQIAAKCSDKITSSTLSYSRKYVPEKLEQQNLTEPGPDGCEEGGKPWERSAGTAFLWKQGNTNAAPFE